MLPILLTALTLSAHAEPTLRTDDTGLMGWGETQEWTLLDTDGKTAAVKMIYGREGDPELGPRARNCNYAGMQKYPTSGVALYLVQLTTGEVTSLDVYKFAWEGDKCTSHDESKRILADAKAAFQKAGLDIKKKPQPVVLSTATVVPWSERPLSIATKEETPSDSDEGIAHAKLFDDHGVYYQSERKYTLNMAGSGSVSFTKGYATPDGLVLVEAFTHFSAAQGLGTTQQYALTPPIPPLK